MREIKFRAKTATTNRWVYGHYAFKEGYHVIYEGGEPFVIVGSTLGQYTSLKDAKGVEIYEYSELDGVYEVIFKDLRYSLRHIQNNDIIDLHDYWRGKNGEIEVTREYTKV